MSAAVRPSLFRRILNRLYPFPLVRAHAERPRSAHATGAGAQGRSLSTMQRIDASRWNTIDRFRATLPAPAELTCLLCGHVAPTETFAVREAQCVFGGGKLVRHECPACEAIFGPAKILELSPEDLSFEYKQLYAYYKEADSTDTEIRTFENLTEQGRRVPQLRGRGVVGVGSEMRRRGFTVYEYEPFVETPREFVISDETN